MIPEEMKKRVIRFARHLIIWMFLIISMIFIMERWQLAGIFLATVYLGIGLCEVGMLIDRSYLEAKQHVSFKRE